MLYNLSHPIFIASLHLITFKDLKFSCLIHFLFIILILFIQFIIIIFTYLIKFNFLELFFLILFPNLFYLLLHF